MAAGGNSIDAINSFPDCRTFMYGDISSGNSMLHPPGIGSRKIFRFLKFKLSKNYKLGLWKMLAKRRTLIVSLFGFWMQIDRDWFEFKKIIVPKFCPVASDSCPSQKVTLERKEWIPMTRNTDGRIWSGGETLTSLVELPFTRTIWV